MTVRALLTACILTVATVAPLRADPIADSVAAIATSVQEVRTAGTWEKDGTKGVYRVVVVRSGPEPVARLFVQWLASGADGAFTVTRTVDIKELIELKQNIGDFVIEADDDGLSIFLEMINPAADGARESYELFIGDDDSYRFGPASN
ncbi:hypothetical protein K32_17490 [Kaistia sp. 32K]|uniref:hypothetical protein n=1 Tax=Kaistia sp. 32K TaxID=2795690 RepID=UPI001916C452|nr:hypothetical protein [Kaistia sp. 32K]BCP53132.1 hypothetical protein K32_17490 [Kaistia sp. 32K]